MKRIMIVEDDKTVRDNLCDLLSNNGYEVIVLTTFSNTVEDVLNSKPDLVLLDVNIPGLNGEVVLQNIRKKSNIFVIMVTSRISEVDEVLSMSYGADDYITKPYNPSILLLRISAVLRRGDSSFDLSYKDLDINMQKGIIKRGEKGIVLSKNEMIIFNHLLLNKDKIVTRDELMTDLWDNDEYINDNALTVNISRLRSKMKELGYPDAIETRKGLGYILS